MDDLSEPLTEQELSTLDDFLLDRVEGEEDAPDLDEGILNISELDGFLTAIVSGPRMVPPSEWLPLVWGDEEPVWDSEEGFTSVFGLMVRHMNGIAGELMAAPEEFEPVFLERTVEGVTHTIVDEWCAGYLRGVYPCVQMWADAAPESYDLLAPIFAFGHERGWKFIEGMDVSEEQQLQRKVAPAARAIHAFWLAKRATNQQTHGSPRRARGIGRNQPCPCGSGRKYKHCCLR
jgi:uncharacterized protein